MAQRLFRLFFVFSVLFASLTAQASALSQRSAPQFVTADQAFAFSAAQRESQVELNWQVKPGYYLYRHQFSVESKNATLGTFEFPHGKPYQDEFFGDVEVLTGFITVFVPVSQIAPGAEIRVTYQGCAEAGFCYPPETKVLTLSPLDDRATPTATAPSDVENKAPPSSDLPLYPLLALLAGLGIAFTPCVLPMYPLISGIILGQQKGLRPKRILLLSFVYVQGMAITYTLLGIVVAGAGLKFQAAFQHPYLLIGLSIMFILLALSMFGAYTLQLPSGVQTWLSGLSGRQKGGSLIGVFAMGAIAGLICSPCTTAPLTAILLYIAQSGNIIVGGGTLYLYALGMGIPLMIFTLFGNSLLPKSGVWLQYVKELLGFVILALPVFLLERIVGEVWGIRMWSVLALAFFLWAFMVALQYKSGWLRCLQVLLLGAAMICAKPLQDWVFVSQSTSASPAHQTAFKAVGSLDSLEQALQQASGKIVMLDFYADWCVACKEFEKYTFTDARVAQQLTNKTLLQADVTTNNEQHAALFKKFNIVGLPTILFFDRDGNELTEMRVTGFMNADAFLQHLQKLPAEG
jgi:thiol:disulfide interchange protein DsbD